MDISAEIAAIQVASQGSELRQPLVGALNKLNSGSLPAVTASDAGKILKVGANGWELGEKSGYMPVPTATKQITENGMHDATNYASVFVNVSGGSIAPNLPNGYKQVLFIEPTKYKVDGIGSYINTGVNSDNDVKIKITFSLMENMHDYRFICGSRIGSYSNDYILVYGRPEAMYRDDSGTDSIWTTDTYDQNEIMNVEKTPLTLTINGKTYIHSIGISQTNNLPIFLFASNNNGNVSPSTNMNLYSCKIFKSNNLIRNFIPCVRTSDSKAGLYDIVNNLFYSSGNSSYEFINGPYYSGSLIE